VPPYPTEYTAFVKVEKMKPVKMSEAPTLKPRIIQGPSDLAKVMCNPSISALYDAVKKVWNGIKSKVLYASGMTPDGIGKVIDQWIEDRGGEQNVIGIWNDFGTYDATTQNELLRTRERYKQMGMDYNAFEWLMKSAATKGVTHNGVKYDCGKKKVLHIFHDRGLNFHSDMYDWFFIDRGDQLERKRYEEENCEPFWANWDFRDAFGRTPKELGIDPKTIQYCCPFGQRREHSAFINMVFYAYKEEDITEINSGQGDTNLIGTIINVQATLASYPNDLDFLMLACGDDNFILMVKKQFTEELFASSQSMLKRLGLFGGSFCAFVRKDCLTDGSMLAAVSVRI
jgi:hypothetical protein